MENIENILSYLVNTPVEVLMLIVVIGALSVTWYGLRIVEIALKQMNKE